MAPFSLSLSLNLKAAGDTPQLEPPARKTMAVWLVEAARGGPTRRVGFSLLLRSSSGPGREARADFDPRAPRPRGGDASLAGGGSAATSAKAAAASSFSMASVALPLSSLSSLSSLVSPSLSQPSPGRKKSSLFALGSAKKIVGRVPNRKLQHGPTLLCVVAE